MKTIAKPRGSGKTAELIKMSAKSGSYIICRDQSEAHRIFDQAKKEGVDINMPITYYEFINKRYHGKGIKGFWIDDIDWLEWIRQEETKLKKGMDKDVKKLQDIVLKNQNKQFK